MVLKKDWEAFPASVRPMLKSLVGTAQVETRPIHCATDCHCGENWYHLSAYPSAEGIAVYFRDITDRKRSEAALIQLNQDLKQFTSAATHDVREPLRAITVFAELLRVKLGPQINAEIDQYLTYLEEGAERLDRLMSGLLDFMSMGEAAIKPVAMDATAALKEAISNLQMMVLEKQAKITHVSLPFVRADYAAVVSLFQNLIANGMKYCREEQPQVHISWPDGTYCVFAVRDNGIGIPSKDRDKVFEPFKRLHGSEIPGAGIGLATCKRIVELHQGRIWLESGLGQGSTFYFSLPKAEDAGVRTASAHSRERVM